jgi:hypothetical protein
MQSMPWLSLTSVFHLPFLPTFNLAMTMAGFALFLAALLVTIIIEVPIVKQIEAWTVSTLPENWQQLRDR